MLRGQQQSHRSEQSQPCELVAVSSALSVWCAAAFADSQDAGMGPYLPCRGEQSDIDPVSTPVKPEASREVEPKIHRWPRQRPRLTPEMATFLLVGGTGYVVDVLAFNLLRSYGPLVQADPT